jgi:alkylation response protein AidB-like acyl-CoA dehydrogenase
MAYMATLKLARAKERAKAAAAAKTTIGRSGRFVGYQAIQLHGGMGMSDEYKVNHYTKRLMMIDTLFGPADHHRNRFADLA